MFTEWQGVDKETDRKFMQMHRMEVETAAPVTARVGIIVLQRAA